jgi:general secretion pathway protein K
VSRPALGLARIGTDEVAAEGLLEGGIQTAAFLLFESQQKANVVNGFLLHRGTGVVRINVVDESGRIDLNAARPELLEGLFAAVGGTSMSAKAFASRVADWRDQDVEVGEQGAETFEYESEGLSYRPANRPFHSVEELRYLLGLSNADFGRLEPFVTVYAGQAGVDPMTAPETVLRAIPGIGRAAVQLILQARQQGLDRERIVNLVQAGSPFLSTTESSVYRVGVQVQLTDGFADAVEAVIVAAQATDRGYRVAAWSRVGAAQARR